MRLNRVPAVVYIRGTQALVSNAEFKIKVTIITARQVTAAIVPVLVVRVVVLYCFHQESVPSCTEMTLLQIETILKSILCLPIKRDRAKGASHSFFFDSLDLLLLKLDETFIKVIPALDHVITSLT